MILLSTAYFGNIQYYSKLYSGEEVLIEEHENYTKQSYRNRCDILSSNGVISLSIPIKKESGRDKIPIREIEIEYVMEWQKQHWRSIVSAYNSSPFFEFYDYLFEPLFKKKEKYLIDHNNNCMDVVCSCINKKIDIGKTTTFVDIPEKGVLDYRQSISPKVALQKEDMYFSNIEYYQVFSEKFPFQKNLSILDLLFCEGNETLNILKKQLLK
ncbi:MAG: WbqC family protein [Rikenellaceae bacterium]